MIRQLPGIATNSITVCPCASAGAAGQVQVEQERADAERAQRHQADLHHPPDGFTAGHRTATPTENSASARMYRLCVARPGWPRRRPATARSAPLPTDRTSSPRTASCLRVSCQIRHDSRAMFQSTLQRGIARRPFRDAPPRCRRSPAGPSTPPRRTARARRPAGRSARRRSSPPGSRSTCPSPPGRCRRSAPRASHRGRDRILHRPEQGGLQPGAEQRDQQDRHALQHEAQPPPT